MPYNDSFGVFPETLPRITRQHMQKMYFSTSYGEGSGTGTLGSPSENMDHVLNMGQKDGKYMKFRPLKAPAFGREFTTNYDYDKKGFEGFQANKCLTENFRPAGDESRPKLDGRSTCSESYVQYSRKQAKVAKLPSQGPSRAFTRMPGSASDSMLVTTSFAQDQHKEPLNASGLPPPRRIPLKPPDHLGINPRSAGTFQSRYMSDFMMDSATSDSATQVRARTYAMPGRPAVPLQPPAEDQSMCRPEVWAKSRAVLLGPGR